MPNHHKFFSCFLLFILLFLIYSNSFNASWHFDDIPNIKVNKNVQVDDINYISIKKAAHGLKGNIKRPLSYISFALNWKVHQNNVFGYHLVNFSIHVITSFLLFFSILALFRSPRLRHVPKEDVFFIALLSTTLWAIHPIQVQAVTNIVQRMASMAAMFYLFGIYFYIQARLCDKRTKKWIFFASVLLSYVFALGSKENAAILPFSLILIELLFFSELTLLKLRRFFWPLCLSVIMVGFLGIFFFMDGNPLKFLEGYEKRGFTLSERLLTEPRILIFYLSQLFYPVVTRLSITHDIEISTSLLNPWTTLPSILLILLLLVVACWQYRKRPLISFAIFFFFINHIIESTIISLELIFEHRNYLPSLFLFLPLAAGIKYGLNFYHDHKRSMYFIISGSLAFLLIFLGFGTYTRNMTWASEKTLWQDAMEKAPQSARPKQNLGHYYIGHNQLEKGYNLNLKAIDLYDPKPEDSKALSYFNMGAVRYIKKEYKQAIVYFEKSLQYRPEHFKTLHALILAHLQRGNLQVAQDIIAKSKRVELSQITQFVNLSALVSLKQGNFVNAIRLCAYALKKYSYNTKSLFYLGNALMQVKDFSRARFFLNRALQLSPNDISIFFTIIENEIQSGHPAKAKQTVKKLLNKFPLPTINKSLSDLAHNPLACPINSSIFFTAIVQEIQFETDISTLPANYLNFLQ